MESKAHFQIVQRETKSGIEVFKYLQLFFNLENYKMWCFSGRCTGPLLFNIYINPYPTAFPYGNGMVLHFYQQQESSTTKTVHKVINKGLKTYV